MLFASAGLARAGVSYDESPAFNFDTRDYLAGLAAESATFSFDTRLADGLSGSAVSGSFAFDTRGATLPPLQITGVLRDSAGVPVAGATIQIKRAGAIFWQGVSGAGGAFTTPNLSGVNYTVIVTKPGYVTSITNITGTAGGSLALNLQVAPMPGVLTTQDVVRDIASGALGVVAPGSFQVFDGTNFVSAITHPPDPNRDTLVLTHGWNSDPNVWAKSMATKVQARLEAQTPNIVAWDWHTEAAGVSPTIDHAMPQGLLLGLALQQWLGSGYSQHVQFVGHSLGTIVNKYACDYVHGMLDRGNPATQWNKEITKPHLTLLDEAEAASIAGTKVPISSAQSWLASNSYGLISPPANAGEPYLKSPIPRSAKWIDNYISAWGIRLVEAVNVCLLKPSFGFDAAVSLLTVSATAHAYSHQWYRDTISLTGPPPVVGFGSSKWIAPIFPPPFPNNDSLWLENLATTDPLDLTSDPGVLNAIGIQVGDCSVPILTILPSAPTVALVNAETAAGGALLNGYETTVQWTKNVSGAVVHKVGAVTVEVGQKIGLGWDAAMDLESDVLNSVNPESLLANPLAASVFKIRLQTQAAPAPLAGNKGPASLAGQPAYAWVTVAVPADAGLMAFDFTVTGDPQEDKIACAINDQNVFTLPAKFASDGQPVSTDMIDVSAYAGQSIELFFGLAGGTSTNCEVAIDGLRFITVPPPKVALAPAGANVAVKWPAAASGWGLESSNSLAPESWQTVPTASGVTVESGVAALEELMSGPRRFYRLRRVP